MENTIHAAEQHSLKWHHFLVNFSLWANMVISIGYGIYVATGLPLGSDASFVFSRYPEVAAVGIVYLILSCLTALYAYKTRKKLVNFEKDAVNWLVTLYFLSPALEAIYAILLCMIVPSLPLGELLSSLVQPLITAVVMACFNKQYYAKRASLFEHSV